MLALYFSDNEKNKFLVASIVHVSVKINARIQYAILAM